MASYKKRPDFFTSEEGIDTADALSDMVQDSAYMTDSSFSPNTEKYANNLIPFVDKHMKYLQSHPSTNAQQYLANLRLMTRIR